MKIINIAIIFNILIIFISILLKFRKYKDNTGLLSSLFNTEILLLFEVFIMYFLIKKEESSWIILEIMFLAQYMYVFKLKKIK